MFHVARHTVKFHKPLTPENDPDRKKRAAVELKVTAGRLCESRLFRHVIDLKRLVGARLHR